MRHQWDWDYPKTQDISGKHFYYMPSEDQFCLVDAYFRAQIIWMVQFKLY